MASNSNRARPFHTTYDAAGNTILDPEGRQFFYDGENKQIAVKDVSDNVIGEYVYDGDGRRVMKKVPLGGGNVETTVFVYDAGGKLVAEYSTTVASQSTAQISYLTNDHLGSPRITTDKNGKVYSRRDFLPFGEDLDINVTTERTSAIGYGSDTVRQKFTGYERDNETELDFALTRMYSDRLGRFASTDPIIISSKRVLDPQRINLFLYSRNNPLRFVDPSGETIEEPTGLSEEDRKAYEKWRDKFLSTEEGRKTWDDYHSDTSFTLKITVVDRGEKNKGAEVMDFETDEDGNLVGATMELGRHLGKGLPTNDESYPVLSELSTVNSAEIGASKIAHEFGHLDDFRAQGSKFREPQRIIEARNDRVGFLTRNGIYNTVSTDPIMTGLSRYYKALAGHDVRTVGVRREREAERRAIPTIRQLFGDRLPNAAKNAMKSLEGSN